MISTHARDLVQSANANRRIMMIFTFDSGPARARLGETQDREERRAKLRRYFAGKKRPLLRRISDYQGVRVVNPLVGSPNIIVSAPARIWRRVLSEQSDYLERPGVNVEADAATFESSSAPMLAAAG